MKKELISACFCRPRMSRGSWVRWVHSSRRIGNLRYARLIKEYDDFSCQVPWWEGWCKSRPNALKCLYNPIRLGPFDQVGKRRLCLSGIRNWGVDVTSKLRHGTVGNEWIWELWLCRSQVPLKAIRTFEHLNESTSPVRPGEGVFFNCGCHWSG